MVADGQLLAERRAAVLLDGDQGGVDVVYLQRDDRLW